MPANGQGRSTHGSAEVLGPGVKIKALRSPFLRKAARETGESSKAPPRPASREERGHRPEKSAPRLPARAADGTESPASALG